MAIKHPTHKAFFRLQEARMKHLFGMFFLLVFCGGEKDGNATELCWKLAKAKLRQLGGVSQGFVATWDVFEQLGLESLFQGQAKKAAARKVMSSARLDLECIREPGNPRHGIEIGNGLKSKAQLM
jgi:hypothetical protein